MALQSETYALEGVKRQRRQNRFSIQTELSAYRNRRGKRHRDTQVEAFRRQGHHSRASSLTYPLFVLHHETSKQLLIICFSLIASGSLALQKFLPRSMNSHVFKLKASIPGCAFSWPFLLLCERSCILASIRLKCGLLALFSKRLSAMPTDIFFPD